MTLKSWKVEFYPITAGQAAKGSLVSAVEHSLQKWIGLRKANLKKHNLHVNWNDGVEDEDGNSLTVDTDSCSLCKRFYLPNGNCSGCPLFESRGQIRCDQYTVEEFDAEGVDYPFGTWLDDHNPQPMITALRKALKWAKQEKENS